MVEKVKNKMAKYNVILILLDGSRIDMLDQVPGLSSMQNDGTFFNNCIVSSPYTIASVHSLFTGMYGLRNGVNSYYNMFGVFSYNQLVHIFLF